MKTAIFLSMTILMLTAATALAGELPAFSNGSRDVLHGASPDRPAAAARDTIRLIGPWGSGAVVNGQFETPDGAPDWNGWTSVDLTQAIESAWHVDTYNVVAGVYSAWCGEIGYESCTELDPEGGYGASYNELLSWYGTVADPGLPATVTVTAMVNHNTEPGYDYSNLGYYKLGNDRIAYLWTADGEGEQVPINASVTYQPGEYVGQNGDQVRLTWHVTSDNAWDDSDCSYYGDGALQIDDVTATLVSGESETAYFHDFEDGTLGEWLVEFPQGVGDYAHLRSDLDELDPCAQNPSPVVCFIADEIMLTERGLPTQECRDWCYGPGGYVVNFQGGLAGPDWELRNAVRSPVIAWPAGDYIGCRYLFDVYRHEDLSADSPAVFYLWGIRTTDSPEAADIEDAGFQDRNFVYYSGPDWCRGGDAEVGDLLVDSPSFVQVELQVWDYPCYWWWCGDNGFPAPYFDNVSLVTYNYYGPALTARELDLAQDAFPADGEIHTDAEAHRNHVRFDMANNISLASDLRNDPGDSIVCGIVAMRTGANLVETDLDPLVGAPRLHWMLKPGPAAELTWRTNLALAGSDGTLDGNGCLSGSVTGAHAVANGVPSPTKWMFDLPDSNFLYPGDVLHYFLSAWDDLDGDYQVAMLPTDRTGFDDFDDPQAYDPSFTVRALPTLKDTGGVQPAVLLWNDFGNGGGRDEWHGALRNLGFTPGWDYDVYYTNAPSSGVGNGLGGRAAYGQIDGYGTILYTCGDLGSLTITNLDFENDAGDDVGLIGDWLAGGGRYLFATGDNLATNLNQSGAETAAFLTDRMGLLWVDDDARPLLGGDISPTVRPLNGNSVFTTTDSWLAFGGCPNINAFDAVTAEGAELLAVFNDGASGLAAGAKFTALDGSTVVTMPYDFMDIRTPDAAKTNLPRRAEVLSEILLDAGVIGSGPPVAADELPARFTAAAYPNPFNPVTRIDWRLPHAGTLAVNIYDVRGQLVRTLVDERRDAGPGHVLWDGRDDSSRSVASGVYFYEVRARETALWNKILLLK